MNILDFEENYNFYKKYHTDPINRLIHIICIPLIVWSASILLSHIKITTNFNLSQCLLFMYSIYYLFFSFKLGLVMCIIFYVIYNLSLIFKKTQKLYFLKAFMIQIIAWTLQILGHILFENNRPAFLDNLTQSFLMAPIFVLNEISTLF